MVRSIISIITFVYALSSLAQRLTEVKASEGEPHESKGYSIGGIIAMDDAQFYTLETSSRISKSSPIYISRYSSSNLKWEEGVEIALGSKILGGYLLSSDSIFLFSFEHDVDLGKIFIFKVGIMKSTLSHFGPLIKFAELDAPKGLSMKASESSVEYSPDRIRSHLFIRYFNDKWISLGFAVISMQGPHILWARNFINTEKESSITEASKISDRGEIYILARTFWNSPDQVAFQKSKRHFDPDSFGHGQFSNNTIERAPNYFFTLMIVADDGRSISSRNFSEEGVFISEMQLITKGPREILLLGLYGNKSQVSPRGCFSYSFTNPDSIKKKKFAFDLDFLTKNVDTKELNETRGLIANQMEFDTDGYDLKSTDFNSEGICYLFAEHHRRYLVLNSPGQFQHYRFKDTYKDILVFAFDSSGNLRGSNKLWKFQDVHNRYFASFSGIAKGSNVYLFYNYSGDIRSKDNVCCVRVDTSVNFEKLRISELRQTRILIVPTISRKLGDGQYVSLMVTEDGTDQFIKFTID